MVVYVAVYICECVVGFVEYSAAAAAPRSVLVCVVFYTRVVRM